MSKMVKEYEKSLLKVLKSEGKLMGFKGADYSIYRKVDDLFFNFYMSQFQVIADECTFMLGLYVKKYSYDEILWNAMKIIDDCKGSDKLRAIGAFSVPPILFNSFKYSYKVGEPINSVALNILKNVCDKQIEFVAELHDTFNSFVLTENEYSYGGTLRKIIAYIDMSLYDNAIQLANAELSVGRTGMFDINNRGVYEYLVEYCQLLKGRE